MNVIVKCARCFSDIVSGLEYHMLADWHDLFLVGCLKALHYCFILYYCLILLDLKVE